MRLSKQAYEDDVRTLHAEVRAADEEGKPVRWIAEQIGLSVAQTHRIMSGLTGPDAV